MLFTLGMSTLQQNYRSRITLRDAPVTKSQTQTWYRYDCQSLLRKPAGQRKASEAEPLLLSVMKG
jgi:hypothetical protein